MARTISAVRAARSLNGMPSAWNSSSSQPTPMPRMSRPLREHVEGRDLLGDVERVALRQDQDAGRELSVFVTAAA